MNLPIKSQLRNVLQAIHLTFRAVFSMKQGSFALSLAGSPLHYSQPEILGLALSFLQVNLSLYTLAGL